MDSIGHDEHSPLLQTQSDRDRRLSKLDQDIEAASIIHSHFTAEEQKLFDTSIGERLAYNDYTTIDWLHDLVKDSYRLRFIHGRKGLRNRLLSLFDRASGWIAAAVIGALTACVAFGVDVAEATVSDWKLGYCTRNPLMDRAACCKDQTPLLSTAMANTTAGVTAVASVPEAGDNCTAFHAWSNSYAASFAIYVAFALAFGIISGSVTLLTKRSLPAAAPGTGDRSTPGTPAGAVAAATTTTATTTTPTTTTTKTTTTAGGKSLYMAAGSGIPEIKTILSGFVIPHFLDARVLAVKAVGAVFAVATGLCLGKEGPFVHISVCVGWLVSQRLGRFRGNGRKQRELLAAACAAGLSVAFGAPIGGVLFAYEEISTYFPRKVLWRAFLCSLVAAVTLKALNPTGTGKLVLFETHYGASYAAWHYLVFALLGVAGGVFGGVFCRLNFLWSRWFRAFAVIKNLPVLEVALVVLVTALLQFPNPLTREPGDAVIRNLLVDCCDAEQRERSWVCMQEAQPGGPLLRYILALLAGTLVKLGLTIITFGVKVPSGVIIPSLDGGALFGRLVGQLVPESSMSPGIFAMVGAAAFLAGTSRMTISLCVIMFELTGELEYVLPHMIAVLVAKWTADALGGRDGVYDLAQTVLGHPFLEPEHAMALVQQRGSGAENGGGAVVAELIPPVRTMEEITVVVPASNQVPRATLEVKLRQLRDRGLMDAGLVLVQGGSMLRGYLSQGELEFGLEHLGKLYDAGADVRLLGEADEGDFDLSHFVDRTPLTVSSAAPMEYAVEMFGKLGLRHLMVLEDGTGRLIGVIIKKRMVAYLDHLKHD